MGLIKLEKLVKSRIVLFLFLFLGCVQNVVRRPESGSLFFTLSTVG